MENHKFGIKSVSTELEGVIAVIMFGVSEHLY